MEAALSALQPPARVAGRSYPNRTLAELMRYCRVVSASGAGVTLPRLP